MKNKLIRYSPIIIIFLVWFLFASPFFIKGLVPYPSRYQSTFFSPWSSYPEFSGPVKNNATPDVVGQIFPWKKLTIDQLKSGVIPLWNPYSFSGTPHLANYQSAVLSPFNLGFLIFKFVDWWSVLVLLQPLLAGIGMYLFIKSLNLGKTAQNVSSIAFMFCGFITTWMMYETLGFAILYLPYALFAVEKYTATKKNIYLFLLFLTIPLSFFSGHFQISIYFLIFVFAYIFFKFAAGAHKGKTVYLLGSVIFGLLVSCVQILPSVEIYSQSLRSGIFQKIEAIRWEYMQVLFAPDFFGNPVTRNDWFGHYAEWNAYIGIIPLLFSFYAVVSKKTKHIIFFTIFAGVSFLLAYQSPLLDLLITLKLPVLSTSAASRIIVLFSFSASVLAGFGIENFLSDVRNRKYINSYIVFGVSVLVFAFLWMEVIFKFGITPESPAFPLNKFVIARSNLFVPTSVMIVFMVILVSIKFIKSKTTQKFLVLFILLLVCLDMYRFVSKWQAFDRKDFVFAKTGVSNYFPKIAGYNRVYGNFGAEDSVYYNLPGIEGYDAVYIRRYGQFIESLEDGRLRDSFRSVVALPKLGKYTLVGSNLLGIKYIVHKVSDAQNVWEFPFWKYDPKTIKLLFDDGKFQILENANSFPRAFLVNSVVVEKDPQKILDIMFSPKTNLKNSAVIEEGDVSKISFGSGKAEIIRYSYNQVEIQTTANKPSFLILTDSYYPGWDVKIDGLSKKLYRTDFTFRGVMVPAGKHVVVFSYLPSSFLYGCYLAIIGVFGMCVMLIVQARKGKHTG